MVGFKTNTNTNTKMPWLSLPFEESSSSNSVKEADLTVKQRLIKKYKIEGIPALVLIDAVTGKTITEDGRSAVGELLFF
jgi:hypothetical protein